MNYRKYEIDESPIKALRRCSRCVLPETMPFIEFDDDGVCNYCKTYRKREYIGEAAVRKMADSIRRADGGCDSLVSFSGGRDSSYGMHYFVRELGLHPLAFSYDWGMVTDLAVRNQKLMCDKLGVKLVTVKADIAKKRSNIRKNILAWLKSPDLGLIPLFMAGDKHYFYHANRICKENGLSTILLASNPFEETHFKSGFCGVRPKVLRTAESISAIERLPLGDVLRMAAHYAWRFLGNPSFVNSSVWDTAAGAFSCYIVPHDYFRLFNYIPWNEAVVDRTLAEEYGWETSPETKSTWRIGDGTSPFYNYIYYRLAGFTENDTLRSNQVREGMLTREQALELVYRDNQPRFDGMKWYFDVVGLDMEDVLNKICAMRTCYCDR